MLFSSKNRYLVEKKRPFAWQKKPNEPLSYFKWNASRFPINGFFTENHHERLEFSQKNPRMPWAFPGIFKRRIWWAHLGLNQGPIGYASHFGFRRPFRVRGLDYPFTRWGCPPSSLYTFSLTELGSGLPVLTDGGFPEFDGVSPENRFSGSP